MGKLNTMIKRVVRARVLEYALKVDTHLSKFNRNQIFIQELRSNAEFSIGEFFFSLRRLAESPSLEKLVPCVLYHVTSPSKKDLHKLTNTPTCLWFLQDFLCILNRRIEFTLRWFLDLVILWRNTTSKDCTIMHQRWRKAWKNLYSVSKYGKTLSTKFALQSIISHYTP